MAPERVDELISRFRESSLRTMQQQTQGLRHHHVLVDRQSGQIRIIGYWDSQEALDAAIPTLEPARQRFWSEFEEALQEAPTLEVYEFADVF